MEHIIETCCYGDHNITWCRLPQVIGAATHECHNFMQGPVIWRVKPVVDGRVEMLTGKKNEGAKKGLPKP